MTKTISYTEPKLCHYNFDLKKQWFVHFTVTDKETKKVFRKQVRGDINKSNSKEGRIAESKIIIRELRKELEGGFNPFEPQTTNELLSMDFKKSISFCLEKCEVASATLKCYRSTAKFVVQSADALKLSSKPIVDVKRMHVKLILEHAKKEFNWSNTSYNKHVNYLKGILKRLTDWEIIENNPAYKIPSLPVAETERYIPYTEAERKAIQEYLFVHHYRFFVYLMVIYQTGIRPKEVLALKISDLDFINGVILIKPNLKLENSKGKKIRKVPVNNQLMPFLRELNLHEYSRDCFIFGSTNQPGKGNCGSAAGGVRGAMHPDYFKPSFVKIKRDTVTKFWKKIIIDKLGINKHLYAMKHTGANEKILAGISIDALQTLYGHSSKLMTERYATVIKQIHAKEIINNSPSF